MFFKKVLSIKKDVSMNIFIQGFLVGLAIAAPIGPIGLLCIQKTLESGVKIGMSVGCGAALADAIYGLLACLGMVGVQQWIERHQFLLSCLGGLFLCYLGYKTFMTKPKASQSCVADFSSYFKIFLSTFLLTLTSPFTMVTFVAIIAGLQIDVITVSQCATFVFGVFLGSVAWWCILTSVLHVLRKIITVTSVLWINTISGMFLFGYGLYSLILAFM